MYVAPEQVLNVHKGVSQYECIILWWFSAVFTLLFRLQRLSLDTCRRLYFQQFFNLHRHHVDIVTWYAIRKSSSVPKTLRTLMLSLAVSDVGVGVFIQPLFTSFLVTWLQMNNLSCSIYYLMAGVMRALVNVSLLSVVAISVDRFLAIHLHLRYKELVTHRRVVAVVISIWMVCTFFSLTMFWVSIGTFPMINAVISTIGFLLSILINIRIRLIVRWHKFQIQSLQLQEAGQCSEVKRLAVSLKSAVCILYVHLMFLVSYFPFFSSMLAVKINGPNSTIRSLNNVLTLILVFLNSTLNPLIYCWKMRHIRHNVIDILRNMPCKRNRALNTFCRQWWGRCTKFLSLYYFNLLKIL